jgi:hypothetical protein
MLAFRNAVQWKGKNGELQPTKVIEFDVQKSKDNVLVSGELSEELSKRDPANPIRSDLRLCSYILLVFVIRNGPQKRFPCTMGFSQQPKPVCKTSLSGRGPKSLLLTPALHC